VLRSKGVLAEEVLPPPQGTELQADVDHFELFKLAERRLNVFYGNADFMFSTVFVDDLVGAIRDAALSGKTIGKGYFIADGRPLTWSEFQAEVVLASGRRALRLNLPAACVDVAAVFGELATRFDGKPRLFNRQKALLGKQVAWTCSIEAAKNDFGYAPQVALEDGIAKTRNWYRSAGWL